MHLPRGSSKLLGNNNNTNIPTKYYQTVQCMMCTEWYDRWCDVWYQNNDEDWLLYDTLATGYWMIFRYIRYCAAGWLWLLQSFFYNFFSLLSSAKQNSGSGMKKRMKRRHKFVKAYLLLKYRLNIIYKSITHKMYRVWLFKKLTSLAFYKRRLGIKQWKITK